jgi:putative salt-induced outer membrane protein YdiY
MRISAAYRSGNTDQTDSSFFVAARRETAANRLDLSLDSVLGSIDGEESVNNHTLRGRQDLYVSPRLYLTPLGLELFRDRFQNIDLRASPYAGLGYELLDESRLEWEVNGGFGYRYTDYDSVPAGEESTDETAIFVTGTAFHADLTERIGLDLAYGAQVSLEDMDATNQEASVLISTDFLWDLDLDLRVVWKRVGDPQPDASGETPDKDDLRIELGLSWEL